MYAFSQVLASGGNVNKAVQALEEEAKAQKKEKIQQQRELVDQSIMALKEANKSEEEKELEAQKAHLHNLAVRELNNLQANEQTAGLASLVDAQKLELLAEQMQGSGVDLEEQKKKTIEAEKSKKKQEKEKIKQRKMALVQKKKEAKRKQLELKKHIEKQFNKLKTEHGGLNGTEDTGYNDESMNAYLGRDAPA